jgi:DUF4097 and DUF4098 domain-containing protein YvlB
MAEDEPQPTDETKTGWLTTRRRIAIAVGGLVVAAIAITVVGQIVKTKSTTDLTFADVISSIEIDSSAGGVTLIDGRNDPLTVKRTTEYVVGKPDVSEKVEDGVLKIKADCGGIKLGSCSANYELRVPVSLRMKVQTSSGRIDVQGVKGDLETTTSSGDVELAGTYGRILANTETGTIRSADMSSTDVSATSESGLIELVFAGSPSKVEVASDSGNVEIELPRGGTSYAIDAASQSGKTTIDARRDTSSPYSIKATSESGDVTVTGR